MTDMHYSKNSPFRTLSDVVSVRVVVSAALSLFMFVLVAFLDIGRTVTADTNIGGISSGVTYRKTTVDEDPLLLGNPSGATPDVGNENNYLMVKPQYTLSYNRGTNTPNWTAWHLDSSWLGSAPRQDDYRADTTLPAGWYRVIPADYSEPVYDRGHMCPSGDRTRSIPDNSATFLMTNMIPQLPANNQGPWAALESYCRSQTMAGNEVHIFSGPNGNIGNIGSTPTNRVVVPAYTWKIILILQNGDNDLQRVTASTRTIGVIMPNQAPISSVWQQYIASVDQIEELTGYDFFSNVSTEIQESIESSLDPAGSPQAISGGTYTNLTPGFPNMTLSGNVTVNGILALGRSIITTGSSKITLGPNATVNRISGMVNGKVERQFASLVNPNFEYPVGTGAFQYSPIHVNLTALGTPGSILAVTPNAVAHPIAPDLATALKRYWTLAEAGDLSARLTFNYVDRDVPANVIDETAYRLQRYATVFNEVPATIDPNANAAVTTNAIGDFSDWTLFGSSATPTPSSTPTATPTATSTATPTATPTASPTGGSISGSITYAVEPKPVPGVELTAAGQSIFSTITTVDGTYSLTNFGSGQYTVTAAKVSQQCGGPANGILANDAALVARYVVGLQTFTPDQLVAASVSGLASVSSFDASLIARHIVGLCGPPSHVGEWQFMPANRVYNEVPGPILGQNFTAILKGDVSGDWNPTGANRPADRTSDPDGVQVSIPSVVALSGSLLSIPLHIHGIKAAGLTSYQFDIEYDPAVIEPDRIAVDLAGTLGEGLSVVSNVPSPGLLKAAIYGEIPPTWDGVYANMNFFVVGSGGTSTAVTVRQFIYNDGAFGTVTFNGGIKVVAPNTLLPESLVNSFMRNKWVRKSSRPHKS